MSPMVSIVIPCYNEESYIEECLDSLLTQTYQDFEILCVDNGSIDRTVDILNRFAGLDDRIQVLFSEGNAGIARNVGMEVAQGKYLLFLDSDDFFDENLLSETVTIAEDNEAEIVLFGGRTYDDKTGVLDSKMSYISWFRFPKEKVFSAEDVADRLFQLTTPAPWTKLFLRQYVTDLGIRFQALPNSNDLYFTLSALSMAERIVGLNKDLVRYRRNKAVSSQSNKSSKPLCFFEALQALKEYLVKNNKAILLANTLAWQILSTTKYNLSTSTTDEAKEKIFNYLIANWSCWLNLDWTDVTKYTKPAKDLRAYLLCALSQYKDQQREQSLVSPYFECVVERKSASAPLISVIVPCYNVADFVQDTLQSLIAQTFSNIEIICIDDGSQDNTLPILIEIASHNDCISVYHQTNSGQSVARNGGLSVAQGDYIYFIDGDDKLLPHAFAVLWQNIITHDLDLVLFDADCFYEVKKDIEGVRSRYEDYYHRVGKYEISCSGLKMLCDMKNNGDYLPSPCLYVAKKSMLEAYGAYFIPGVLHEDNAFTFQMMLHAQCVMHVSERFYLRRLRDNSVMMSQPRFKNVYGYFVCIKEMLSSLFTCKDKPVDLMFGAYGVITNAMGAAKRVYSQLPAADLGGVLALDIDEAEQFKQWIGNAGNDARNAKNAQNLKKKNEQLNKDLQKANAKIKAIEKSGSYKLSRKISAPLKKIRKIVRRHGR